MFKLLVQRLPVVVKVSKCKTVTLPFMQQRLFATGSDRQPVDPSKLIPDNFFDEQLEVEREFLDFARSLKEGGLDKLTVTKHTSTKSSLDESVFGDVEKFLSDDKFDASVEDLESLDPKLRRALLAYKGGNYTRSVFDEPDDIEVQMRTMNIPDGVVVSDSSEGEDEDGEETDEEETNQDPSERLFLPHGADNPNEDFRRGYVYPDELLHDFIPATSEDRHNSFNQGSRACPGKLQRRGRFPELKCHKIDLDELSHLDVLSLKEYLTEDGEIIPKKGTGLCSKCQRQVAKTIKAARNFGLLPHIGQFAVSDSKPHLLRKDQYHEAVPAHAATIRSKTLL